MMQESTRKQKPSLKRDHNQFKDFLLTYPHLQAGLNWNYFLKVITEGLNL